MINLILSLGQGSLKDGFGYITARIYSDKGHMISVVIGALPGGNIAQVYQNWQNDYLYHQRNNYTSSVTVGENTPSQEYRITQTKPARQVSVIDFREQCQNLKNEFRDWLSSPEFGKIESHLRTYLWIEDEICIFLEASQEEVLHLPWHLWEFLDAFKKTEIVLSNVEFRGKIEEYKGLGKVRILVVFGNTKGLNVEKDRSFLERLPNTDLVFLTQPSMEELHEKLYDEVGYDILFYAGHSRQKEKQGYLELNASVEVSVNEIKSALEKACQHGLQLAIFNSCDGLALAQKLASLNIPQTIVMREPILDHVAEKFLESFLPLFANGLSPHLAIRETREKLQALDSQYHCASWLPVLYQNPSATSKKWHELGRKKKTEISASPYKGLLPFKEEDAEFFYGRTALIERVYRQIQYHPVLPILGTSGSGKSSLVQAGLIPLLVKENWSVISLRPTENPLQSLAQAFGVTQASLSDNPRFLENYLREREKTLVFVDQLEELYSLSTSTTKREIFLDQLLHLGSQHRWIFTLRADFLGQGLTYPPLANALQNEDIKVSPMNKEEMQQVIELPAKKVGVTLEEGLSDYIIRDIQGEIGYLPLLEFTLTELWDKRQNDKLTHSSYQELGGVKKAITLHADKIYNLLPTEKKPITRQIFLSLVQVNLDQSCTRRRVLKEKLLNLSPLSESIINQLAAEKLIILSDHHVDLVHEALIEYWDLFKGWIEENIQELSLIQKLEHDTEHWQEHKKSSYDLLQGTKLQQALEIPSAKLSPACKEYRKTSKRWANRRIQRRWGAAGISVICVMGVFLYATKQSFDRYYNETIPRVQRVEFNMFFHTLPYKLSAALIGKDDNEINELLGSHHNVFGLVVTDCKTTEADCPQEKVLYSRGKNIPEDEAEIKSLLTGNPYDILQDPPPLHTRQYYQDPYDAKLYSKDTKDSGKVIGRVYYVGTTSNRSDYWQSLKQFFFKSK